MKCFLGIIIFLKRSLVFPILSFSCISLHWSLRKTFLSLLAILWNSAFRWIYLFLSHLPFTSLLFSAICKAFSDNYFAFLHFFFLGIILIMASHTILWTSVHSFSGTLWLFKNVTTQHLFELTHSRKAKGQNEIFYNLTLKPHFSRIYLFKFTSWF